MKAIQVVFALVLALGCFNVGVFGNILELGLTIAQKECKHSCVNSNHGDTSYWADSVWDLRTFKCHCRSKLVEQCRATCTQKYNDQAYQKSYISKEGYCLCKKE